jgi:hypothetical protein
MYGFCHATRSKRPPPASADRCGRGWPCKQNHSAVWGRAQAGPQLTRGGSIAEARVMPTLFAIGHMHQGEF